MSNQSFQICLLFVPIVSYPELLQYTNNFCLWEEINNQERTYSSNQNWCWGKDFKMMKTTGMQKDKSDEGVQRRSGVSHLIKEINFESKAKSLMKVLESKWYVEGILIFGKMKSRPKHGSLSLKRSSYIGVMKNGDNWQAFTIYYKLTISIN